VAYYFNSVSLVSPLANMATIPQLYLLMPTGYLMWLTDAVKPEYAPYVGEVAQGLAKGYMATERFFANIPMGSFDVNVGSKYYLYSYYSLLLLSTEIYRKKMAKK